MEFTGYNIIILITFFEYISLTVAREIYCGTVKAIPMDEQFRRYLHGSIYWRKKLCMASMEYPNFNPNSIQWQISRTRLEQDSREFIAFSYTTVNSSYVDFNKATLYVDSSRAIFEPDSVIQAAKVVPYQHGLMSLKRVSAVKFAIIQDRRDYRIFLACDRSYAAVEITDDLMARYENTTMNPLQHYENEIADELSRNGFQGTCTNIVANRFPFRFPYEYDRTITITAW